MRWNTRKQWYTSALYKKNLLRVCPRRETTKEEGSKEDDRQEEAQWCKNKTKKLSDVKTKQNNVKNESSKTFYSGHKWICLCVNFVMSRHKWTCLCVNWSSQDQDPDFPWGNTGLPWNKLARRILLPGKIRIPISPRAIEDCPKSRSPIVINIYVDDFCLKRLNRKLELPPPWSCSFPTKSVCAVVCVSLYQCITDANLLSLLCGS